MQQKKQTTSISPLAQFDERIQSLAPDRTAKLYTRLPPAIGARLRMTDAELRSLQDR